MKKILIICLIMSFLIVMPLSFGAVANYSLYHGKNMVFADTTTANGGGFSFKPSANAVLVSIIRQNDNGGSTAELYNGSSLLTTSTSLTGDTYLFNNVTLLANTNYSVLICNGASNFKHYKNPNTYTAEPFTVTNSTININITNNVYHSVGNCGGAITSAVNDLRDVASIVLSYDSITNFTLTSNTYGSLQLLNYSAVINGSTLTTTNGTIITQIMQDSPQLYNITLFIVNNSGLFNFTLLNQNVSQNMVFNYSVFNLSAVNIITNLSISNFTNNLTSTNYTQSIQKVANGTTNILYTYPNYNYTVNTSIYGYNYNLTNITVSQFGVYNQTIYLYSNNTIQFYIYNVSSLQLVNGTSTTVNLFGSSNYTNVTTNGLATITDIIPGTYTLTVSNAGFEVTSSSVVVGVNSYQTYNVYLSPPSSSSVIFTLQDGNGGQVIENATILIETTSPALPTNYSVLTTKITDITGSIQLSYIAGNYYRFSINANNYNYKRFELKPIIFTEYTVYLTQNNTVQDTDDFQSVSVTVTPAYIYNNNLNNFSYTIVAPKGNLQAYGFGLYLDYSRLAVGLSSGTSAYGGVLTGSYLINTTLKNATVGLQYWYILSDGTKKNFTKMYYVDSPTNATSGVSLGFNAGSVPLLDRVIIMSIIIIMAGGLAYMFGGFMASGAIGLLIMGYFIAVSFVPVWVSLISMVVLIVVMLGGQRL